MAKHILAAAQPVKHTPQYQLPSEARQAILTQSDAGRLSRKIECQRQAFMSKNFNCPFGLKTE